MSSVIRIDDLTLDTGRRSIARGTKPIQVGPLTYKLLLALIEAAPDIATHDDLANSVWSGRAISPGTISQRIKLLRDALSDDAANPRYIQVLHGQGYRLIPPVNVLPDSFPHRSRKMTTAGIAAVLALVVAFGAYNRFSTAPGDISQSARSIAVLPFVDMSPAQDQEYFADGVAEEILNLLAETTTLQVIARTSSFSFKGRYEDMEAIRNALDVSNVLEGSLRKSGNRVRIAVQLVDTASGTLVWSATYDRELGDILLLQSEIASSVATALKAKLSVPGDSWQAAIDKVDEQAFDSYLRGLKQLSELSHASLVRAGQYFEQAIEQDPAFIKAYYGLGMAFVWQVIAAVDSEQAYRSRLREIVDRGLKLAPGHAGLIAISGMLARFEGDYQLAVERLERAMALTPSDIWIRTMYAGLRLDQSYPDEALTIAMHTYELDPLNWLPYTTLVFSNIDLGNADEALKAASRFSEVTSADDINGELISGFVKVQMYGDLVGGIRDWESVAKKKSFGHEAMNLLAIAYYSIGDTVSGNRWLERARQEAPGTTFNRAVAAYRAIIDDDVEGAREIALDAVINHDQFTRWWGGIIALRLAVDALIERGEASRAVDLMLELAPEWESYMDQPHIAPEEFSPTPYGVKSSYSSNPALYFPDFVRALRASGNIAAAENMLNHFEGILAWRRERGLLVEEIHVAEALALRDRPEAALEALERAEQNGTIYNFWHLRLLHNGIFDLVRNHPRYEALLVRVAAEMNRQRRELSPGGSFEGRIGE